MMARTAAKKASPKKSAKASKAKAPRRAKSAKPVRKAARKAAKPAGKSRAAIVRAQVARRRPGMGAAMVSHEHQDPSIVAPPPPPPAPVDHLHQNWGDAKERSVTRADKPTNWFRQAPKPKAK